MVGNKRYRSPEILSGSVFPEHLKKSDVFCCGLIFYEVLCNFTAAEKYEVFTQLQCEREPPHKFQQVIKQNYPPFVLNLLENMTKRLPEERLSSEEAYNQISLKGKEFFF